jgi:aspartyl-tRNA(Asn)/glutamyl-tRNA(Gln) amidotransferase subunit A
MNELSFLSASELAERYRSKQLSPVELVKATLSSIDELNPLLNAFRVVDHEAAMAAAKESETRWLKGEPLGEADGVPFGVKDLVLARGHTTRFGSRARLPDQDTTVDAPAVARLRESGAVFLGKTTTSEFGWKGTCDSPLTGITRNPWNTSLTPGGSSGGAASAAAAGMGVFQIGTDGGGSVRIPASFTGVFGMKATFGRVPAWPAGPMMTLSNVGVITRTVDDGARMLNIVTQPDPRDWHALPPSDLDFLSNAGEQLTGKKFGLFLGDARTATDGEVERAIRGLARLIEDAGGVVEEVCLPLDDALDIFVKHWYAGAQHLVSQLPQDRRGLVDKGLADAAHSGAQLSIDAYYGATFARQRFGEKLQALTQRYDALITPTLPIVAFEVGREWPEGRDYQSWFEWACFLYPFNLSRQPAASVPIGLSTEGLPIGAQIIGPLYKDAYVIAIARAIERLVPQVSPRIRSDTVKQTSFAD